METGSFRKKFEDGAMNYWIFWIAALFPLVGAVLALWRALTSNVLVAGPDFRIDEPSLEGTSITLSPGLLDHFGLRVGWAVATALVFLGVAILLITLGQIGKRVPAVPLFSKEIQRFIQVRAVLILMTLGVGGFVRRLLDNSIREELGIVEIISESVGSSQSLDGWLFDVPFVALYVVVLLVGWVLTQGAAVQEEAADIV